MSWEGRKPVNQQRIIPQRSPVSSVGFRRRSSCIWGNWPRSRPSKPKWCSVVEQPRNQGLLTIARS